MRATLPNSFSRKVFLASGDKGCTDFGSDFKCFSLYRGVVHFEAENQRWIVVFLQAWHVRPITFPLTSFMGRDSSFLIGFLHILQVNTDEDIVYYLWGKLRKAYDTFPNHIACTLREGLQGVSEWQGSKTGKKIENHGYQNFIPRITKK